MKKPSLLLHAALAGCLAIAGLSVPSAQAHNEFRHFLLPDGSSLTAAVGLPGMHNKSGSYNGTYTSSDGTKGTFVETRTLDGSTTTDKIVYTQATTALTSTDTAVITLNTDGSATLDLTHLGFGSTVPFTSDFTFAAISGPVASATAAKAFPGPYGVGTYTYANGATGTASTFVSSGPDGTIAATDLLSGTGGLTRELMSVQGGFGNILIKQITVAEDGTVTTTSMTLLSSHDGKGGGGPGPSWGGH